MEVFFYGLFMDSSILSKNGIQSTNPRKGYLENYTLKIGNRASLIPSKGGKSYGLVMTVNSDKIQSLYAEASVSDYVPEEVEIILDSGEKLKATCYNLPLELLTGTNESYAKSLYRLAQTLDFPKEYLDEIKQMSQKPDGTTG
ncbi:hypothetical protein BFP97_01465 [Roseivirga sp. 4D4]|uniref:gamma-glutamylcyclotransferase family protein n=1 Tax=Roseivirga sp. 4D4 TaxID=1889784 RepID=UPI0008533AC7|nr:gamma-glutamylcyclotransferase family protein [Roseivirga sp. 4D4]OEK00259.1 hypothetical protein BFP97_01465 [Roseivirga sp. 4D4]